MELKPELSGNRGVPDDMVGGDAPPLPLALAELPFPLLVPVPLLPFPLPT